MERSLATHREATDRPASRADPEALGAGGEQVLHEEVFVPLVRVAVEPLAARAIRHDHDQRGHFEMNWQHSAGDPGSVVLARAVQLEERRVGSRPDLRAIWQPEAEGDMPPQCRAVHLHLPEVHPSPVLPAPD